ncbi:GGDEF domain-containing protein [Mongoliimonas terrestris]|uniref:GGDEF domain-containing protein n=1 Tax=Mongoliimonas terrestris TaxID=1709001 RepID=UPI000949AA9C|nr:diguanylate cyclase [Mongoliimonas terrestris]
MTAWTQPRPDEADAGTRTAVSRRRNRTPGALGWTAFLGELDRTLEDLVRDRTGVAGLAMIAVDDGAGRMDPETADRVREAIGQRIAGRMRGGDVLGQGADGAFVVLLRDCPEPALHVAAERFRDTVSEEPVPLGDTLVQATASVGVLLIPRHARDRETALARAAAALADARAEAPGSIRLHDALPREERRQG